MASANKSKTSSRMPGTAPPKTIKKASLRKAENIVDGYSIKIQPHEKFGYIAYAEEFPTGFGRGKTAEGCVRDTRAALTVAVAIMLERGGTPPHSKAAEERTAQVNVRVTPYEKEMMQRAAIHLGYRGLGDFVRSTALSTVHSVLRAFTHG